MVNNILFYCISIRSQKLAERRQERVKFPPRSPPNGARLILFFFSLYNYLRVGIHFHVSKRVKRSIITWTLRKKIFIGREVSLRRTTKLGPPVLPNRFDPALPMLRGYAVILKDIQVDFQAEAGSLRQMKKSLGQCRRLLEDAGREGDIQTFNGLGKGGGCYQVGGRQ